MMSTKTIAFLRFFWKNLFCGLSKSRSFQATESFLRSIKSALESGKGVLISSFVKFRVKEKGRRKGRNTGCLKKSRLWIKKAYQPWVRILFFSC
ncbi:MAG: HU family DNA-binding protein [Pseudomonadota bacterium]